MTNQLSPAEVERLRRTVGEEALRGRQVAYGDEIDPVALAYERLPTSLRAAQHRAAGRAPAGAGAQWRMAAAAANTEQVREAWGSGYWSEP